MPKPPAPKVMVRPAAAPDEQRWRELFAGYCLFYQRPISEPLTRHTWARILDAASPVHAIVAEDAERGVIGIANYVVHEHTLGLTPVCYLGDLFVDPAQRAGGVGEQLIAWLVAEMQREGWSRLYWHTRLNNYRARGLYDKFTPHSDFVRYTVYPES
jgi:GNAT superfamily N-acetyltransferase